MVEFALASEASKDSCGDKGLCARADSGQALRVQQLVRISPLPLDTQQQVKGQSPCLQSRHALPT